MALTSSIRPQIEKAAELVRVYLDPSAMFVRFGDGEETALAPDAPAAVRDLVDTGHEAVLLADSELPVPDAIADIERATDPEPGLHAWMITGDRRRCRQRRPWLRTVLVGGGPAPDNDRWRCDAEAADLRSAVIHIVSREAMP